jgi:hypothetical protein
MNRADLSSFLRSLDALALAALLRELGVELYRREIARWRVLAELSDELIDSVTFSARRTLARYIVTTPASRQGARRPPRRRRRRP